MIKIKQTLILLTLSFMLSQPVYSNGVNSLSAVAGVRGNPIAGYGLVAGLNSTKSKTKFNRKNIRRLLVKLSRAFPRKIDRRTRFNKVSTKKESVAVMRVTQKNKLLISSINENESLLK